VVFQGKQHDFPNQNAAYIWTINQFQGLNPRLLEIESVKPTCSTGRGRRHIARTPEELFKKTPDLVNRSGHYGKLDKGTFVILHININEKLKVLESLSEATSLLRGRDWEWNRQF
jgi:hypothetical protein